MTDFEDYAEAFSMICEAIPTEDAAAIIRWFNTRIQDLDQEDARLLISLFEDGRFTHFQCGHCNAEVNHGDPECWDEFQGVMQDEYLGGLCGECASLYIALKELADD